MKKSWLPSSLVAGLCGLSLQFASSTCGADWPQWRGPQRDGHATASGRPLAGLPKDLQPLWRMDIGGGHSSPVVAQNILVVVEDRNGREVARALEAATGRELWKTDYADSFKDEWGVGPRATPLIDGDRVYVQACNGEFRCLDLKSGQAIWGTSFEKDFGVRFLGSKANEGTASRRGNNGSGVIDGQRLVLPVGDTRGASLVCFDKSTGKVLWKTGQDEAAYSSLMAGTLAGVRQVVAFTAEGLVGAEMETGKILWRVPLKTNAKRHAATPVILGDRVLVNSHTIGMVCLEIRKTASGLEATPAWENKNLKINLATPVHLEGYLYSQGADRDFVCVDARTGETKWSQPGFGTGRKDYASTIALGKNLLVLTEDGQLLLIAADPAKYRELARLQVCGSTWSHPAYSGGRLFIRDGRQLQCVDLTRHGAAGL